MSIVDNLNSEYTNIQACLTKFGEHSLASDVNNHFKKNLILSAASFFEHEIQTIIITFVTVASQNDQRLISFVKKKGVSMQYHTYFTWGEKDEAEKPGKNANSFLSLFGEEFKAKLSEIIKQNKELDNSVRAFIELGHLRNLLVHSNFAAYNFENKTTDEIFKMYEKAILFIDLLKENLK